MKSIILIVAMILGFCSCTGQIQREVKHIERQDETVLNSVDFANKIEQDLKEYQTWGYKRLVDVAIIIYTRIGQPFYEEDTNRLKISLKYLDKAIELNVTNERAYTNKYNIQCSLGNYRAAIILIQNIADITKHYSHSYLVKGLLFEKMNNMDSAKLNYKLSLEAYNQQIKVEPEFSALVNRAIILSLLGNNAASMKAIEDVIKNNPSDQQAVFVRDNIIINFNRSQFVENNITQ